MIITFCRTGDSQLNGVWKRGQTPFPLSSLGQKQSEILAKSIAAEEIDYECVFSNDIIPSYETAVIIGDKLKLPVFGDKRLRNRHLGIIEGEVKQEFIENHPLIWKQLVNTPEAELDIPKGEKRINFEKRISEFISELPQENNYIIVLDGDALREIFRIIFDLPFTALSMFRFSPASKSQISINARPQIVYLNNRCHLPTFRRV